MAELTAKVDAVDLLRKTTVVVRVDRVREMKWRIWLGMRLLALAVTVLNCDIEVLPWKRDA